MSHRTILLQFVLPCLILLAWASSSRAQVGKVGINTTAPAAMLHVMDSSVLFTCQAVPPVFAAPPPVSGPGSRMMWYPDKVAFRAGRVTGTEWDKDSTGQYSVAFGYNAKAKGQYAFVGSGFGNAAVGSASAVCGGLDNTTTGSQTFVGGGFDNTASGFRSFVGGGSSNIADELNAFVGGGRENIADTTSAFVGGGEFNVASGLRSFIGGGSNNAASMDRSFVGGGNTNSASGVNTFTGGGHNLLSKSFCEAVFGLNNTDYTPASATGFNANDRLFVIGNGTNTSARSNAVTVLKNGRVGIGIDTPQEVLHVEGTIEVDFKIQANDADGLELATDDGTTRVKVADTGNVGIGTNSPARRLHVSNGVSGATTTTNATAVFEDDQSLTIQLLTPSNSGSGVVFGNELNAVHGAILYNNGSALNGLLFRTNNNVNRMVITDSGEVGIGTTAPSFQLHVNTNSAGKPTSNVWTVASDGRLKRNVHDYTDGLSALMKVRPVWFTYTGEANLPEDTGVGVIAQELEEVAPYMIGTWTHEADGQKTEYLSVDNGAMTYMLINAVKEQQAIIEELKSANDAQATRLNAMEQELADIKAMLNARPATASTTAQVTE